MGAILGEARMPDTGDYNPKTNVLAQDEIWRDRVRTEMSAAREFDGAWGFLKAGGMAQVDGAPVLSKPKTPPPPPMPRVPPTYQQLNAYKSHNVKAFHLADMPTPKEQYDAPRTTNQKYGWYNNLEMFGVAENGFKRVGLDWPAPSQT